MRVLFVCTANICRSPMASALFAKAARDLGAAEAVSASAGFLAGGRSVHDNVTELLADRGIDVARKHSQQLSAEIVNPADLILAMTSEHARGVVSRFPTSISKVYTMRHFATVATPRPSEMPAREWLTAIHAANRRSYLGDNDLLDIPDPIGHEFKVFKELAVELEGLIDWMMGCAYPANNPAGA